MTTLAERQRELMVERLLASTVGVGYNTRERVLVTTIENPETRIADNNLLYDAATEILRGQVNKSPATFYSEARRNLRNLTYRQKSMDFADYFEVNTQGYKNLELRETERILNLYRKYVSAYSTFGSYFESVVNVNADTEKLIRRSLGDRVRIKNLELPSDTMHPTLVNILSIHVLEKDYVVNKQSLRKQFKCFSHPTYGNCFLQTSNPTGFVIGNSEVAKFLYNKYGIGTATVGQYLYGNGTVGDTLALGSTAYKKNLLLYNGNTSRQNVVLPLVRLNNNNEITGYAVVEFLF